MHNRRSLEACDTCHSKNIYALGVVFAGHVAAPHHGGYPAPGLLSAYLQTELSLKPGEKVFRTLPQFLGM